MSRIPHFSHNRLADGGELSVLGAGQFLPPGRSSGSHICLGQSKLQGHRMARRIMSSGKSSDLIWNSTKELAAYSIMSQPTTLLRAPRFTQYAPQQASDVPEAEGSIQEYHGCSESNSEGLAPWCYCYCYYWSACCCLECPACHFGWCPEAHRCSVNGPHSVHCNRRQRNVNYQWEKRSCELHTWQRSLLAWPAPEFSVQNSNGTPWKQKQVR
jgi:hypothetical protein